MLMIYEIQTQNKSSYYLPDEKGELIPHTKGETEKLLGFRIRTGLALEASLNDFTGVICSLNQDFYFDTLYLYKGEEQESIHKFNAKLSADQKALMKTFKPLIKRLEDEHEVISNVVIYDESVDEVVPTELEIN